MKDNLHVDQRSLARIFGCSVRTVQRYEDDGLRAARVGRTATYDLPAAVAWRIQREREQAEQAVTGGSEGVPDLSASKARKELALARLRELEVAEREKDLVRLDHVLFWVRDHAARTRQAVESFPARYTAEMAGELGVKPRELGIVLADYIRRFLTELADEVIEETYDHDDE